MTIKIYTDGSCAKNPGPGGWAAIIVQENTLSELSGKNPDTTNNRMELYSAIAGLERAIGDNPAAQDFEVYSDSAYLVNCFRDKWWEKWVQNGWRNSAGKPVENKDLWQDLLRLVTNPSRSVAFKKVKGHADDVLNNRCDELARKTYR